MPAEPVPAEAVQLLGEQAAMLVPYALVLAGPGIDRGLLGPRERPRLWDRHLLNCAVVAGAVPTGADVVDVGSGAGLPGLVWALLRPDLRVVLVEPLLRRSSFLTETVNTLGLANVRVIRARAEVLAGQVDADLVTARALAPLPRLGDWCLPLVRPGGQLWALRGRTAAAEVAEARLALQRGGASNVAIASYGEGVLDPPTTVVQVTKRVGVEDRGADDGASG